MKGGKQGKGKSTNGQGPAIGNSLDPISHALKRLHDEVASEPLPDEFLQLLSEIDRKIGLEESRR